MNTDTDTQPQKDKTKNVKVTPATHKKLRVAKAEGDFVSFDALIDYLLYKPPSPAVLTEK